jgi:geranylgeranyl diphosphate synthase type I
MPATDKRNPAAILKVVTTMPPEPQEPSNLQESRRSLIESTLDRVLTEHSQRARSYGPLAREMAALLHDFVLTGGKRLRGMLAMEGFRAIAAHETTDALPAAVAIELLHAFLLIHDDIIDQDELRRGKPTFHFRYRERLSPRLPTNAVERLAGSMAILGGDLLCALAVEQLNATVTAGEYRQAALHIFCQLIQDTGYGELLDVLAVHDKELTEDDVLRIYRLKTARYSFEGPLIIGATLAGASAEQLQALSGFAIPLGIAFQLQDDLIGMFGDVESIGKPVGSDIKEGKRTPLVLYGLEHAAPEEQAHLHAALGNPTLQVSDIARTAEILTTCGSRAYVERMAAHHEQEARTALAAAPIADASRRYLATFSQSLTGRTS